MTDWYKECRRIEKELQKDQEEIKNELQKIVNVFRIKVDKIFKDSVTNEIKDSIMQLYISVFWDETIKEWNKNCCCSNKKQAPPY